MNGFLAVSLLKILVISGMLNLIWGLGNMLYKRFWHPDGGTIYFSVMVIISLMLGYFVSRLFGLVIR